MPNTPAICYIVPRGDKALLVNIYDGNGWDFSAQSIDVAVIMAVIELYLNEFDPELLFSGGITISNSTSSDAPITLFSPHSHIREIHLRVDSSQYGQLTLQLAHELTHFFLRGNSEHANNWLFETIAEVASLFFLKRLVRVFSVLDSQVLTGQGLHNCGSAIHAYRTSRLNSITSITDPVDWYRKQASYLLDHKIDRKLNLQAAQILLPLFESQSGTWNVLLCAPLENTPLNELLPKWITRCNLTSPRSTGLLHQIHTTFLGTELCPPECPKTEAD